MTQAYDGNGNLLEKHTLQGSTSYAYDSMNALVRVKTPEYEEYFTYDHAGNRMLHVREEMEERYTYNACNRLMELCRRKQDETETVRYAYDANGNMIRDEKADYVYDALDRTVRAELFSGEKQVNRYDAEGLRAEMEENGALSRFVFDGQDAVAEEEQDGNIIRYIRGLDLIGSDSEKARTYYHYAGDELGSVVYLVRGGKKEGRKQKSEPGTVSGKDREKDSRILNHYAYDAFGNATVCEEREANRFRFQGQQYDRVTGQYYLRARFYNPVIGRFLQEDTVYEDGLNLYAYCKNNPVYYEDPSGRTAKAAAERRYREVGADPETAKLAAECYPDAASKKHLYDKYKDAGYTAKDAQYLADYEIIHGKDAAEHFAEHNMKPAKGGAGISAQGRSDPAGTGAN